MLDVHACEGGEPRAEFQTAQRAAARPQAITGTTDTASCDPSACVGAVLDCPLLQPSGVWKTYAKGEVLFWDGDPNTQVLVVVSGVVRGAKILDDGRRQICRFAFPGDVIDYSQGEQAAFTAEAICEARVLSLPRAVIERWSRNRSCLANMMTKVVLSELGETRDQLMMIGRLSAIERVTCFLERVCERMGTDANGAFNIPMSRQDMADYLGLTIETVSRVIGQLKRERRLKLLAANTAILYGDGGSPVTTTCQERAAA